MLRFFLCLLGAISSTFCWNVLSEETLEKTAEKLMLAWWEGDFDTLKANCTPRHQFLHPGFNFKFLADNLDYSRQWLGELKKLKIKQIQIRKDNSKSVRFHMSFPRGTYYGGIFLSAENRFTGAWGPFLDNKGKIPELDKKQMLEDFDYMVTVLHDTMPHDLAIREEFGIDVWNKFTEYRSRITGRESPPEFARLIQQALAACKGHHLWLIKPLWDPKGEWYLKYYAQSIPPETLPISRNMKTLLDNLASPYRPATFHFLYWDGDYYTAPEFSIDGKKYQGPLKLISVDGKVPQKIEPQQHDKLWNFDCKHKRFFHSDFYTLLPSPQPDRRTFLFETPAGTPLSITIPDNAKIIEKQRGSNYSTIRKQVLFLKKHNLVYLRVPSMNMTDLSFYDKELKPILEKEKPRYAVIDIRGNAGGSDGVPMTLLRKLSARPVHFKGILGTPANERVRRYMKLRGKDFSDDKSLRTIPFLNNRKLDIWEFTMELKSEQNASVEQIYVIAHDIYSAAGTLVAVAKANEHITAIGFSGTTILGMGINPYFFALPNSKLIISVEPAIDLTNCRNAAETLHLKPEIDLPMSPREYLTYLYHPIPADCRAYLETEDPFMQKIFAMIQEREVAQSK